VSGVTCHVLPVAEAYCTDQPLTETGAEVGLYSSMKSLRNVAPALPPPPYTWLITRLVDTVCGATSVAAGPRGASGRSALAQPTTTSAASVAATLRARLGRGRYMRCGG